MNFTKFPKSAKTFIFVLLLYIAMPHPAFAGIDEGKGNDGVNNGKGNGGDGGDGGSGSVPVNSGLVFLVIAGGSYAAKKFYDARQAKALVR